MPKKTSTKQRKESNSRKTTSKPKSDGGTSSDKSTKRVSVTARSDKRYVRRDSAGRFVEVANEHLLRAWNSIHKNTVRERKAG
ncbi:MAG TPA: hypothetical protein DC047_07225 [Blastocatellia bacterium]|nr:hypothetical protein [Blastocatellia bacterium]